MVTSCETHEGRIFKASAAEMDKYGNPVHSFYVDGENRAAYFDFKQLPSKNHNKTRYRLKDGNRFMDVQFYQCDNDCVPATLTLQTGAGDIRFEWGDGEPLGYDIPEAFQEVLGDFFKNFRDSYYEPLLIGIVARLCEDEKFWKVWES